MRLSFFKLPKAKAFNYKPLYYDPKNDAEINSTTKEVKDADPLKLRLKAEMNEKWAIGRHKGSQARGFINSKNLLIYLAIALLLLYFIFF
ncbi:MAG: hypothetical protein ACOYO1_06395 [Bacteroidales bacterium]